MNRFDARLELELSPTVGGLVLFAGFPIISAIAMGSILFTDLSASTQAMTVALFPLWVALVMHGLNSIADSKWTHLVGYPNGDWTAHRQTGSHSAESGAEKCPARGPESVPVTLQSNFQCQWMVLLSIRFTKGCRRELIWRRRHPDSFRYLLASLASQISKAQEA